MCPACIASASLVAGSVISTGGVAAMIAKVVSIRGRKKSIAGHTADAPKEFQHPQTKSSESKGE